MAQAMIVQMVNGSMLVSEIPEGADLVCVMGARGFEHTGFASRRGLRPELQGQPTFAGLIGPMWGGEDCPLRYEDSKTNDMLSM